MTTRPHDIRAVFVSDLHLSANTPTLNHAFICLVQDLAALPHLQHFFILGDFLDAWLGDEDYFCQPKTHWLQPILSALQALPADIYLMHGNRDFMLGQRLCDVFGGRLVSAPYDVYHSHHTYRLVHGDELCTDDIAYQRYRRIIRNPVVKFSLSCLPLHFKQKLSGDIKQRSNKQKKHKAPAIMDVNAQAVAQALQGCNTLIHGHTHRPNTYHHGDKQRIVLGDWQDDSTQVQAVIGLLCDDDWAVSLVNYRFVL